MSWNLLILFLVYLGAMVGLLFWVHGRRKQAREGRFPVPEDTKSLRRAGEHLSQELICLRDRFEFRFLLLLGLPLVGLLLPLGLLQAIGVSVLHVGALVSAIALLVDVVAFMLPSLLKTMDSIRDHRLGLYGERLVADQLTSLLADGYQVYHDVPCLGGSGPFNLDHVVVGKGLVVVVETKTYRKPRNVAGDDHKVRYDDERLHWPDKTSTQQLEQVQRNARWLRDELKKKLDLDVPVKAALTIPGWYVIGGSPQAPVLVEGTKRLPRFICDRFRGLGTLKPHEEKLVNNHLRNLCETVGFESMPDGL